MGEAGAGDVDMRRVVVVERDQHPLLLQRRGEIDRLADAAVGDDLAQRRALAERLRREIAHRPQAFDQAAFAAHGDDQRALVVVVDDLGQSHAFFPGAAVRASISGRMRGSAKSATAISAPAASSLSAASVVVSPTTASPAPFAALRPESESSNAIERPASAPSRASAV